MLRDRYNYPTPPIRDIKGKETQTRNNWTLMETSLAESQKDSYFPTKWPNGYPKQKRFKRHTHSKTNYNKNKPWPKNRLGTVSEKSFTGGVGGGGGRGGERSVKNVSLGGGGGLNRFYVATILAFTSAAI